VLFEAAIPCGCALVWGVLLGYQKNSVLDGISAAAVAFFLALSLQNQILRVTKHVRDDERQDNVDVSLESIMHKLEQMHGAVPMPSVGVEQAHIPADEELITPHDFVSKARALLEDGIIYPALLTASVGFEVALQEAARRYELDVPLRDRGMSPRAEPRPIPNNRIVQALIKKFGDQVQPNQLIALTALRNGVVHARPDFAKMSRETAVLALQNFEEAIERLTQLPW